jgi:hypothetical protein
LETLRIDGPADRHLTIREALLTEFEGVEEAFSEDNTFSVFLLPWPNTPEKPDDAPTLIAAPSLEGGYWDHHKDEYASLDDTMNLVRRLRFSRNIIPTQVLVHNGRRQTMDEPN